MKFIVQSAAQNTMGIPGNMMSRYRKTNSKRCAGHGNDDIDVLLGILGTEKIGQAPLLGFFSSERQIQDVAQQNDILSGGLIEYGFHPVVDRSMRRGGPAFRREQGQNFFGTRRLIGVGL